MKRSWVIWGWLLALAASAIPAWWEAGELAARNPLGKFADPVTGAWTAQTWWVFVRWWLPIAAPVSLLALACMFLNRPADPR